jgi:hypothetical protein
MSSSFICQTKLRGAAISLGGLSYRVTRVYRTFPSSKFGKMKAIYKAEFPCRHVDPQLVFLLQDQRKLMIYLSHVSLPNGDVAIRGAAEVKLMGPVHGPDRWLEVPAAFPLVPSAVDAIRITTQRRRVPDPGSIGPAGPLAEIEELLIPVPRSNASDI